MHEGRFFETVEEAADITREEAERAVRATLRTLGERITRGQAEDIAASLPRSVQTVLTSGPEPAESFGLDEFVRRVAEREGVDVATAYRHIKAVFAALGRAVTGVVLSDMAAQLSKDFDPLLDVAWSRGERRMPKDPLVGRVAQLAAIDEPLARDALEAVLETLAVRISEGEVEDLMKRLPPDLIPPLRRGLAESRKATRMSLEEFLDRVADIEGVSRREAESHTRAVFAALREFVPGKELYDVESELPAEYAPLFSGII